MGSGQEDATSAHDKGNQDETMESETTLLPKSILAGKHFDVGDSVELEIVAIHGDEVEVRYKKDDTEESNDPHKSQMEESESGLSAMANGNRRN